jgi:hypothetical protein
MATNKDRVLLAWSRAREQSWPPKVGEKVKLFQPKDFRGKVVTVIASQDEKSKISTRFAPAGKIRVRLDAITQFSVGQHEVIPKEYTPKAVATLA